MEATLNNIEALETLPVKIDYIAEVPSKWDADHKTRVDQWAVTLTSKHSEHRFDYFTGFGCRKEVKGNRAFLVKTHKIVGNKWVPAEPVKPKVAAVLASLLLDSTAAESNFSDWCADLGLSDDSFKAMATYKQCLETAVALRKHFSPDTLKQIKELLQDY